MTAPRSPDAAPAPAATARPVYRDRQVLTVESLRLEQTAREESLQRHVTGVHGTPTSTVGGVAAGLRLVGHGKDSVVVTSGLAVDGCGEYLGLEADVTVSLEEGTSFLVIVRTGRGSRIAVLDNPPPPPSRRSGPAWPVVLGTATRAAGVDVEPHVTGREQLVLTAQTITAPAGTGRVVLGPVPGRPNRVLGIELPGTDGGLTETTTVQATGNGHVRGDVRGDVRARSLQATALAFDEPVPPPAEAAPWSLYRTAVERADGAAEQLRAEVGEVRAGIPATSQTFRVVQAGNPSPDLLVVDAAGTVTIPGGLLVRGTATFRGGGGPGGAATSAAELALQTADVLARAQQLLAARADLDLTARQDGLPGFSGTTLRYSVALAAGPGVPLHSVAAYETVVAGEERLRHGFVVQGLDLAAGARHVLSREIDVSSVPPGVAIDLTVLAVGVGPDGQPRTGTYVGRARR
ncbi:hypothetical protein ACI78V_09245 [Geodermatophilus sp. SYSU D00742]